jgi:RNA polymerase sigma factor (sigma-70 family)
MNICECLNNIKKLDQLIEAKIAERGRLIELATDISAKPIDGMPYTNTGTVSQKMQDAVLDLVVLEAEIVKAISDYTAQKQQAVSVIEKLPEKEYAVLHRYYIRGMTLEAIAEDIGYSARQVGRIKGQALRKLAEAEQ